MTHCVNDHHVDENSGPCLECALEDKCDRCGYKTHEGLTCSEADETFARERMSDIEVAAAERAAGWDPNP